LQQEDEEDGGVTGLLRSTPVGILYLMAFGNKKTKTNIFNFIVKE